MKIFSELRLKKNIDNIFVIKQKYLIISFINQSILLSVSQGKLERCQDHICCLGQKTVTASEISPSQDLIVWVTKYVIQVIDPCTSSIKSRILAQNEKEITQAQVSGNLVAVFLSDNSLVTYNVDEGGRLCVRYTTQFNNNCAALALGSEFIAVGLWLVDSVQLYNRNQQAFIQKIETGSKSRVSSLIFHETSKILIGFSEGTV